MRHLLSLTGLSSDDLSFLIERGLAHAEHRSPGDSPVQGLVAGILFRKTSTRTRTAFPAARCGWGRGSSPTGRPTCSQHRRDGRGHRPGARPHARSPGRPHRRRPRPSWRALAAQDRMAVVNAMSAEEHPTQALADLTTIRRHFGQLEGLGCSTSARATTRPSALALGSAPLPRHRAGPADAAGLRR